jgi:hypothetical protein
MHSAVRVNEFFFIIFNIKYVVDDKKGTYEQQNK